MNTINLFLVASVIFGSSFGLSSQEHLKSLNPAYFDNSIDAGTDFYRHVNKGWMETHPLSDESARRSQFDILTDSVEARVKRLLINLGDTNPVPGSDAYKILTLYSQGMDSARRNSDGARPILDELKRIETASSDRMEDLFLWMHTNCRTPFFRYQILNDVADSNSYALYIRGGGMGLGDRDYYLGNDDRSKKVREAYCQLIVKQMQNAGYSRNDANRIMKNVMKIETSLADSAWTREQSRNIPAMYNVRSINQLQQHYPHINWNRFFVESLAISIPSAVIVTEPSSISQANNLMGSLSDREMKDYYLWPYVNGASGYLSDQFSDADFEFAEAMSGVQQQRPRWKRALEATEAAMGEAVGKLYIEKYFSESSKHYMLDMVENLRTALGKHIINLTWMSDDTKLNAIKKLNALTVKIGYPDRWKDYSSLDINPAYSYYENMHNVAMRQRAEQNAKWGYPVDKTEWNMTPHTVNAYANALANEIVFPAGILQAPFFDPEASDAENYGGIGVVIGHEMTHGFDDQGRNFDADGNMTDWWTPADSESFANLTAKLVAQFDEVEVLPGVYANGRYTLGENIADQGGLRVSRTAFLDSQKKKGIDIDSDSAFIDGLHPMQVYYMNYANIYAANIRDEEIRALTTGDVHSLGENRVNVTLRNIGPFFEAFGITDGDKLYRNPQERVVIW